ncbi:MAG: hypothetical protein ACPKPY_05830 [Nitrososphaeraceae archaeon]
MIANPKYLNNFQIKKNEIQNQNQQQQKINIEKQNQEIFFQISKDCINIPFWIPSPHAYADYNPQQVSKRFDQCNTLEEQQILINKLKQEDYENHKKEYDEHKILYKQTLDESYKKYKQNELPHHNFIRPRCCWNHYMGLPSKLGHQLQIFDYELHLVHKLITKKRISLLKARGLGATEIAVVRFPTWVAFSSDEWKGRTGSIITGIRMGSAIELMNRIRRLFSDTFPIVWTTNQNMTMLKDVRFLAFPADNPDSLRLYDDFCFIMIDEAAFFSIKNQMLIKHAVKGYTLKSQPIILWISTPNQPGDLMEQFQRRWNEKHNIKNIV